MVWRVSDGLVGAMQERLMELHGQAAKDVRSKGKLSHPVKTDSNRDSKNTIAGSPKSAPVTSSAGSEGEGTMPPPPLAPTASAPVPIRQSDAKKDTPHSTKRWVLSLLRFLLLSLLVVLQLLLLPAR